MASTIDELQVLITAETKQLKRALADVYSQLDGVGDQTKKASGTMSAGFDKIGKAAKTGLTVGVVGAIAAITASIPSAVKRIDTLNNSARTFENMGFKTNIAEKAVKELEKSIMGLPTPLDSAIRGMTSLSATYGDVELGQKVFTSLNNAILGFGGTAAEVDNAIQQLSQLPMDGPLDAQTWNSLRNSGLTPVLVAMSKEFGMSVSKMKEAFGDGTLTVGDFTAKLTEMNEKGGGGLKSLQQIAQDSTKGIGTSFANLQTAITRAVANVIKAFGPENFSGAINGMANVVNDIGKKIVAEIPKIQDGVQKAMQKVFEFGDLLKTGNFEKAGKELGTAIGNGITTAIKGLRIGMDTIKEWFASIDWGQVGIAVGGGALAFVAGLIIGLFSEESLSQFVGFIADNWLAVILTVIGLAFAPAKLLTAIGKPFVAVISKIPFGPTFINAFNAVVTALRAFVEPIRAAFHTAVVLPITTATGAMVGVVKTIITAIKDILLQPFRLGVAAVADTIKMIPPVAGAVVNAIKAFFAPMVAWFTTHFTAIFNVVSGAFSKFMSPAASALNSIKSVFSGIPGWFASVFQGAWNNITSIFRNLGSWFSGINLFGAGQSIINGFIGGIKSMIGAAKNAASSVVKSVRDFFPFSPAKTGPFSGRGYTTYSGQALMKDFASGISSQSRMLSQVTGRSIGGVFDSINASSINASLPSSMSLSRRLDMDISPKLPSISTRQTPVVVNLDGETLLSFVIDGMNDKSFMSNGSVLNI